MKKLIFLFLLFSSSIMFSQEFGVLIEIENLDDDDTESTIEIEIGNNYQEYTKPAGSNIFRKWIFMTVPDGVAESGSVSIDLFVNSTPPNNDPFGEDCDFSENAVITSLTAGSTDDLTSCNYDFTFTLIHIDTPNPSFSISSCKGIPFQQFPNLGTALNWQWSTEGDASDPDVWEDFNLFPTNQSLAALNVPASATQVYFRIGYEGTFLTPNPPYTINPCPPEFDYLDSPVNASCFGASDGSVILNFSEDVTDSDNEIRVFVFEGNSEDADVDIGALGYDEDPLEIGFPDIVVASPRISMEQQSSSNYTVSLDGLQGSNSTQTSTDYYILYQEVNYDVDPVYISGFGDPLDVTIQGPSEIIVNSLDITQPPCPNTKGSVKVNATGGGITPNLNAVLQYGIQNGTSTIVWQVSNTFDELDSGNYKFFASSEPLGGNPLNCLSEVPADFTQINEAPTFEFNTEDTGDGQAPTPGNSDGTLEVELVGGTSNIILEIYSNSTFTNLVQSTTLIGNDRSHIFTGLPAGIYYLRALDSNNPPCVITSPDSYELQPAQIPELQEPVATPPSCNNDADGEVSVVLTGIIEPYQYRILDSGVVIIGPKNGTTSPIFENGLSPGTYTIEVIYTGTGSFSIAETVASEQFTITNPIEVSFTATPTPTSCIGVDDGSIEIAAIGGTQYQYTTVLNPGNADWQDLVNNSISDLGDGSYNITIRNQNQCTTQTQLGIIVNQPDAIEISASPTDATTNGGNDGAITLTLANGTGPYEFNWTGTLDIDNSSYTNDTQNINDLLAGTYQVTVTDANDCTALSESIVIDEPGELKINDLTPIPVNCKGDSTGSITADVTGTGLNFVWERVDGQPITSVNSSTITGLAEGDYRLTLSDGTANPDVTSEVYVAEPTTVVFANVVVTPISCEGVDDGSLVINATGGTPGYTYSLNGGDFVTTNTFTGLTPDSYSVVVRDENGCEFPTTAAVGDAVSIEITEGINTAVTTNGGSDGTLSINVEGGTSPYTSFVWTKDDQPFTPSAASTNTSLVDLESGTYSVTVTDSNTCERTSADFVISEPDPLSISNPVPTDVTCNGGNDGSITIDVEGPGTISYEWRNIDTNELVSNTGPNISNIPAGTYVLTATTLTPAASVSSAEITIDEPVAITATVTPTDVTCFGADNGQIQVTDVQGGTGSYLYDIEDEFENFQSSNTFNNLEIGTYLVTVKDANNCEFSTSVAVGGPLTPIEISVSNTTNVTANGGNDGTINITVSGGTPGDAPDPDYTFSWTGILDLDGSSYTSTTQNISNLSAGSYQVIVTDANSCTQTLTQAVVISEPGPLAINSLTPVNVDCKGDSTGSITADVTGTGTLNFIWERVDGQAITSVNNATISNLAAGEYLLRLNDATTNPEVTSTVTITEPTLDLSATAVPTNISCFGANDGQIEITAVVGGTAGYTYSIDNGITFQTSTLFSGLAPNSYTVVVRDANNCEFSTTATVGEPTQISISVTNTTTVTANGGNDGAIDITVSGGTPGVTPNEYIFSWTGILDVDGSTYSNTTQDINTLSAGSYQVVVTDANSCTETLAQAVVISEPGPLSINSLTPVNVDCKGDSTGSISADVTGTAPFNFIWERVDGQAIASVNNATISGLAAGDYRLRLTDATTNPEITSIVTITEPTLDLSATSIPTNVNCFGADDGQIEITNVVGGTAGYSYSIDNGTTFQTSTIFSGLAPNSYTVVVRDANNCEFITTATIIEPAEITVTQDDLQNVSVSGGNDGSIAVTVNGGTQPYDFIWSGPNGFSETTEDITGLSAGTYTLEVRDANNLIINDGCYLSQSFQIIEPGPLTINSLIPNDTDCNGASTGGVIADVTGNTPIQYVWSQGGNPLSVPNSPVLENVPAGIYTLTITDATATPAVSQNVTINEPTAISATATPTDINCFGSADGQIQITNVVGGTGAYTYSVNGGTTFQASDVFSNLSANTYAIIVKDANDCEFSTTATVGEPLQISITVSNTTNVTANEGNDGAIEISVTGGTPGVAPNEYSYSWSGILDLDGSTYSGTTQNISNLSAGTYQVTVTDANTCAVTSQSITISEPGPLSINSLTAVAIDCKGDSTGSITANVTSTGTLNFVWERVDGQTITSVNNATISNLAAGEYRLRLTDATTNPEVVSTVTIAEPTLDLSATVIPTDISCFGNTDGQIEITNVEGGTPGYQYSINGLGFQPDGTFNNLASGTYTITVRDANNCEFITTAEVVEPSQISLSVTNTTNITVNGAADGTINLAVSGSTGAYNYTWLKDGQAFTPPAGSTDTNIIGLEPGSYELTVNDSGNASCAVSLDAPIVISEPTQLSISNISTTDVTCNAGTDGAITTIVTGSGTIVYDWRNIDTNAIVSTAGPNLANIPAGTYVLTVTDDTPADPVVSNDIIVTEPTALDVQLVETEISCFGADNGSLQVNVTGGTSGYTYSIDNGTTFQTSNVFSGLAPNSYTITVLDANNCTAGAAIILNEPTEITITLDNLQNVTTSGGTDGSITVSTNGGPLPYAFLWTGPNGFAETTEDITGLSAGTYTLEVRDANNLVDNDGCFLSQNFQIIEPGPLTITNIQGVDISCFGANDGSITASVQGTGAITYIWTRADNTVVDGQTGPNLTNVGPGTYTLTIDDETATPAVSSAPITLNEPTELSADAFTTDVSCTNTTDGSVLVTALNGTPGYQYSIDGGISYQSENTFNGLAPGNYTVRIQDNNLCSLEVPFTINQPLPIGLNIDLVQALSAANATDGAISITAFGGTGNLNYSWTGPNGYTSTQEDISNLAGGTYTVTIRDDNWTVALEPGCSFVQQFEITEPGVLNINITQSVFLECNGDNFGELTATIQGGVSPYTIEWFEIIGGSTNQLQEDTEIIANLSAGSYFARITDANNISADSNTINISEPDALQIQIDSVIDVICNGDSSGAIAISVIGGTAPYNYGWSNGETTQDLTNLNSGNYDLLVNDANGCLAEIEIVVNAAPDAVQISNATVVNSTAYLANDGSISIEINGGAAPYNISWVRVSDNSPAGNSETISNLSADLYTVTISDFNGCTFNETYEVAEPDIVEETVVQPSCQGNDDGSISILVNQGTGTFTYSWNTGQTTSTITNLGAGTYTVIIDGFGNGPLTRSYTLVEPEPVVVDLGEDSVLCAGQELALDATVANEAASYVWSSDNGFSSNEPIVTISTTGNYSVTVQTPEGCSATGTVFVTVSTDEINAEFAMSSQVFTGETLIAVDISFPLPDTIEWIVPEEANILTKNNDEVELVFDQAGEYEIGMITTIGECVAQITKKVLVTEKSTVISEDNSADSNGKIVENFLVYPNPTNGQFTADIELSERGDISIKVFNFANNGLMASENARGESSYSIPFDISGLPSGVYAVLLETPFGTSLRKVIVI